MRRLLILSIVVALGGCQLALPGGAARETIGQDGNLLADNPITGDAITVTSLDAPEAARVTTDAPALVPPDAPALVPPEAPAVAEPPPPPPPEAPAPPVVAKSPAHQLCEKKGGRWSMAGSAKASFCQTPTKDAGKSCRKETDCNGYCLAKSGTCAPYTPLFGCNDILTAEGRMITQCIN